MPSTLSMICEYETSASHSPLPLVELARAEAADASTSLRWYATLPTPNERDDVERRAARP